MNQQWADYLVFWREFRGKYHSTGAILPSGRALARALSRWVRESNELSARRILEVGPGTGAVTGSIVQAMRPNDRLVLVERNDQFVERIRARLADDEAYRNLVRKIDLVHASVEELPEDQPFDLIISGLPLNNFSGDVVAEILAKLERLLAPGGTLSFFEYVAIRRAKAIVSRRAERERLRSVARVTGEMLARHEIDCDLVMSNVPPAWVHHVRFAEVPVSEEMQQTGRASKR